MDSEMNLRELRQQLTPEVRRCVLAKLGREKVREAVREYRRTRKIDNQVLAVVKECIAKPSPIATLPSSSSITSINQIILAVFNPPLEMIGDFPVVWSKRKFLLDDHGRLRSELLDRARSAGTKVGVWLYGQTSEILNDNGVGLNLEKYEDRINDFAGKIDPYVSDGTIIGHLTIDEPHDRHDWGVESPLPEEVDQASAISKKYWPNLSTLVNTTPDYAIRYQWVHTDIINFQYAFHKGPLEEFIRRAVEVLDQGRAKNISWSIMAQMGGGAQYGQGPMTPEQVEQVGRAMLSTGKGLYLGFVGWRLLKDEKMRPVVESLRQMCGVT